MKNIKNILVAILAFFLFNMGVYAASGSITVSSGTKTAAVGSTFKVSVKVSCSEALGSWQFGISYDSSVISLVSGDTFVADVGKGDSKTKTYSYTFKAIAKGNGGIRITGASMVPWSDVNNLFTPSTSGTSVTVKTQAEIQASYSKDNDLKSLTVEGYEISPAFSKDVTEYTVSVPDTITSIKVDAKVNDGTARVSGAGEIDISEGINKVELVVTAQNGSTKTYTLTVDVKDLNPINVDVGGVSYTVVKKSDLLTEPVGHTPTTININGEEIPAFKSELTNFTIVGLKDDSGKISMFIYDEDNNTYMLYEELKGTSLTLYPKNIPDVLEGFKKVSISINDKEYEALVSEYSENFYLIYAMNVETGKEGYFIYDKVSNGFVNYDSDVFETLINQNKEFKLYLYASLGASGILLLITIILAAKRAKLKKLFKKISKKEEISHDYENEEVEYTEEIDEAIVVDKIENSNTDNKKRKRQK